MTLLQRIRMFLSGIWMSKERRDAERRKARAAERERLRKKFEHK